MSKTEWDQAWEGNVEEISALARKLEARARAPTTDPANFRRILVEDLDLDLGNLRSLEIGCGYGRSSADLALHGVRAELLDYSPAALAGAARLFSELGLDAELHEAPLEEALEVTGGGYDLVLSVGLVEHFEEPARTDSWRTHLDLLRPGGIALLTMPNALCPPYRIWKAIAERFGVWSVGYEDPYSPGEIREILESLGVEGGRFGTGFRYALNEFLLQKAYWAVRNLLVHRSLRSPAGESFEPTSWFRVAGGPSFLDPWFGYSHVVWFRKSTLR